MDDAPDNLSTPRAQQPPYHPPPPPWQVPGGGYPPPPYPYPPAPPYPGYPGAAPGAGGPRNGLGIGALAVAVVGLLAAVSVVGGVVLGALAMLLGFLGYGRVKRREADNRGVAIAGIVLGALAIVAGICCALIYLGMWRAAGGEDYLECMKNAGSDTALQQGCTDRLREHLEDTLGSTVTPSVQRFPDPGVMHA